MPIEFQTRELSANEGCSGHSGHLRWVGFRAFIAGFTAIIVALTFSAQAIAQDAAEFSFGEYEKSANHAADLLSSAVATNARSLGHEHLGKLSQARDDLAKFRDHAAELAESGTLETRILAAQLEDLGSPPADDATEPSAISQRRIQLDNELSGKMGPIFRLREANVKAATLVSELDDRINELNRIKLFRAGRSPLNPSLWLDATSDIGTGVKTAYRAVTNTMAQRGTGAVLLLAGAAFASVILSVTFLIWIWRKVDQRLNARLSASESASSILLFNFLRDFAYAAAFTVGIAATALALMFLLRSFVPTEVLLESVVVAGIAVMIVGIAEWFGRATLASPYDQLRLLRLPEARLRDALTAARIFGVILAIEFVIEFLEMVANATIAVTNFISILVVAVGSWALWRVSTLIKMAQRRAPIADQTLSERPPELAGPLSRALQLFAIAIGVTAILGYMILARHIFVSAVMTLAVVAIAIYLHRSAKLVIVALGTGPLAPYRRLLRFLPMLAGAILLFGALFVAAIVWGFRIQEIMDVLGALRNGVRLGDIRISTGDILTFAIVFGVGYVVTRWVQQFLKASILPEFELDTGGQAAIVTGIGYLGILLAAMIAIASTGLDLSSLAFIAGALSVGLGFGLQSTIENFTSGVLLLVERPIKEGDWIEVGEHSGIVRKIAVRSTQIETFDHHFIIIPNSQLITGSVKNLSFGGGATRITVPVGVAYDTDLANAQAILLKIASENDEVLADPEPAVGNVGFGDSSIDLKLMCHIADVTISGRVASDLKFAIAEKFAAEGIEIPFPQRDLNIRTGTVSAS